MRALTSNDFHELKNYLRTFPITLVKMRQRFDRILRFAPLFDLAAENRGENY